MHNIHIAEWILALVTSQDRAMSTIGDLTEEAATRGVVWFWSHFLRTAASFLWRDITEDLARFIKLAFLGLAVYIGIDLMFAGISGAMFFIAYVSGHPLHSDSIGWSIWFITPALVSSLLIGRMLARRAPGRELAACLVYATFVSVYNLVPVFGDNGGFSAVLCILTVLAGAAWGRYRTNAATQLKLI
jgi:hypothetical protein